MSDVRPVIPPQAASTSRLVTPSLEPRADGRCVVCESVRRRPARGHKTAMVAWEHDPFCSTACAKRFHGVTVTSASGSELEADAA